MKEGTSPEVLKARESRGEPRVGRVRGSGPCRGVIERPGGSRHDIRKGSVQKMAYFCNATKLVTTMYHCQESP